MSLEGQAHSQRRAASQAGKQGLGKQRSNVRGFRSYGKTTLGPKCVPCDSTYNIESCICNGQNPGGTKLQLEASAVHQPTQPTNYTQARASASEREIGMR